MQTLAELPGPRGLPLLGNVPRLLRSSQVHLAAEGWAQRYGPIYRLRAGSRSLVVVADEGAINEILRNRPEGYRRGRDQRRVLEEMTGPDYESTSASFKPGVFVAEGEDWKRQRRLVVTALNANRLHRYFHVVRTATERLRLRLLAEAHHGRSIAISELLSSFTVDVASALALGDDINTLERGDGELQRHIQRVMAMTARRLAAPVPYWRWMKLPADRALDRSLREMYKAIEGFIERGKARLAARPELYERPENLLDGMLAAQRKDGDLSDQEIVYNIFTILLAGEDTTAQTLGWTVWLLASSADVQERLAAEATEVLGGEAIVAEYQTIERLTYAEAVLRESIRLKAVAPLLFIEPTEDKTVCGTRIPAGTQMILLLRHAGKAAAGRSDEFYPERWLDDSEETRAPKLLAFGAGPRFCPGRNLAFLESKAALAMIARNFELTLDESGGPVRESFQFALVPRGLRVRLRERQPGPERALRPSRTDAEPRAIVAEKASSDAG